MAKLKRPEGLGSRGGRLWDEITKTHDLDAVQRLTLEECARMTDRLDVLAELIASRDITESLQDKALGEARQQQNVLKQLLVSLRLPDESGKKPQQRGARGAYAPSAEKSGKVSSLDRARQRKSG